MENIMNLRKWQTFLCAGATAALFLVSPAPSQPKPGASYTSITSNGAWTWYGNPDAVYFEGKYKKTYMGWISNNGVISVASYNHATGDTTIKVVRTGYAADDHNHPSLLMRPDGRLMVFFSGHDGATMSLYISTNPEDISAFDPEIKVAPGVTYCYPNPMFLSAEGDSGRIFLFYRSMGLKPCFSYSDDWGKTWTATKNYYVNVDSTPKSYVNYCSNGKDEIHIVIEKGHRAGYWPLYYLKYKKGAFYKLDGTQLATMDQLPIPNTKLDTVMNPQAAGSHGSAWDIALDYAGKPVVVYDQFKDGNNHLYFYCHWMGTSWLKKQLVNSGATMGGEDGFAGGITLNHDNTNIVYMSRQINGMHEIDKWATKDGGTNWDSVAITRGSAKKNTRPIVPRGYKPGNKLECIWMYGDYTAFTGTGYNTAVKMYAFSETVSVRQELSRTKQTAGADIRILSNGISIRGVLSPRVPVRILTLNGRSIVDAVYQTKAGSCFVSFSRIGLVNGSYLASIDDGSVHAMKKVTVAR
jgi:hypothetical protein